MSKRKHLEISQKKFIVEHLEESSNLLQLSQEHGISSSTLSKWRKNKTKILADIGNLEKNVSDFGKRKTVRKPCDEKLEAALFKWFQQRRGLGDPITDSILHEMALIFDQKLNEDSNFRASNGFIQRFKERHQISQYVVKGEILSGDTRAAEEFKQVCKA